MQRRSKQGSRQPAAHAELEGGVGQGRFLQFVPDPTVFFFTIDVAQSCAREWTHVSCFKDYDNHGLESDAAISGPEIYV